MRYKIPGVYSITNITNGKRYIGRSYNIGERWYEHKRMLKRGVHHSSHLQASWDKYGEENFVFEILQSCKLEEIRNLKEMELYWIAFHKSLHSSYGYNIYDESKAEKKIFKERNGNRRIRERVYQLSLQNEIVKIWDNTSEAAESLNECTHQFSKHLFGSSNGTGKNNKAVTKIAHKGFVWIKETMYEEGKEYYPKVFSRSTKGSTLKGDYLVLNFLGEITHSFPTKLEVANYFNTTEAVISVASSTEEVWRGVKIVREGNYDGAKDYSFQLSTPKYTEVLYKIQNTITQEIIEIFNISQTARDLGIKLGKLHALLKGERKENGKVRVVTRYKEWIKIPL